MKTFLDAPEVRSCMPPLWRPPKEYCRCSPRINIGSAAQPFGDRVVFIGDCATSKLRKDGIGVACRTATVAANTALFWGVAKEDSRTHDQPGCKKIESDNVIARLLRAITSQIRIRCYARRAVGEVQVYTLEHDSLFRRIQDPFLAFKLIQQMSYRSRQLKTTLVRETKLAM